MSDTYYTVVCHVTKSKVKVKVVRSLKSEGFTFLNSILVGAGK